MSEIWGLTGGIATGKSTVSTWLREAGLPIIDADVIARQVVAPGTPGLSRIEQAFGAEFIHDGALDRQKLGQLVFHDPEQLHQLESITTPRIQAEIQRQLAVYRAAKAPVVVIDAPTLFEVGYLVDLVDHILVVATDSVTQQQRLMARNHLSAVDAQARMARQWPIEEKIARATVVIDNGGTIAQTLQQVVKWLDTNNFGKSQQIKRGDQ
ncbi:dephospho-CoA kinase [Levilactobacillus yonginensis]|uniref:dephospho-CoA kinase n=1 Tax=Levilactobacillus yonginensis TaxID=1054041 RepID=UPI000F79E871|nr:dephospho-CoA kinase [Levilactobacillus yonginensis]